MPAGSSPEDKKAIPLEIAHVLFIDIVGYSKLSIDQQQAAVDQLTQLVRATKQFQKADSDNRLVKIAAGDGMALVFYTGPDAPARCAMELSRAPKTNDRLQLRMGMHSGPVSGVTDVTGRTNLAGAGLNFAQRVMNCGDAGHILLSRHVAEDLSEFDEWKPLLHDLGPCEVKHGVEVSVVSLYGDGIGNATLPDAFRNRRQKQKQRRNRAIVFSLILAGAIAATGLWWSRRGAGTVLATVAKSVAVLPFENLSDDKANAYFVAGMQDEILTALAKVTDLKVISRTSTAKYQSHPANLKTIAQELGVAAILEGSVQRLGNAVHINVQLMNAREDAHLWAESYDRELKNVFGVEREVAETVAAKLKAQLSPQDTLELSRVPTSNPEAYDRYLKGEFARNEFRAARANSLKPAIAFFKEAVALDPHFAVAYTKLAEAEMRYHFMEEHSPQMLADGRAHLAKALELEPDLIEAHLLQAIVYEVFDHDQARALAEVEPLVSRAPNDPRVVVMIADAKEAKGDMAGALDAIKRAIELDPHNKEYLQTLGDGYVSLRRYREGIETLDRVRTFEPEDWVARLNIVGNLMSSDRLAEAHAELQQWPDDKLQTLIRASKYAYLQQLQVWNRNYDAALVLASKIPDIPNRLPTVIIPVGNIQKNTDLGFIHLYQGDKANAEQAFTAARNELEPLRTSNADSADFYKDESFILAGLGQHNEAVEAARKATTLSKADNFIFYLAQIYAHFDDADLAFETMQKRIDSPTGGGLLCAASLRHDPMWDPIRKDPRFEKAISSLAAKEVN